MVNLLIILLLIQTICRRLPDVDRCALDRFLGCGIQYLPVHIHDFRIFWGIVSYGIALLQDWRVISIEGTQDRALSSNISRSSGFLVSDFIHQTNLVSKAVQLGERLTIQCR
jgi:hypothetical protein